MVVFSRLEIDGVEDSKYRPTTPHASEQVPEEHGVIPFSTIPTATRFEENVAPNENMDTTNDHLGDKSESGVLCEVGMDLSGDQMGAPKSGDEDSTEISDTPFDEEKTKFKKGWDDMCEKINQGPESCEYRQNLEILLAGMRRQEEAEKRIFKVHEMVETALDQSLQRAIKAASPIFEYLQSYMEVRMGIKFPFSSHISYFEQSTESHLVAHFTESHALRKEMMNKIELYNTYWNKRYKDFKGRLLNESNQDLPPEPLVVAENAAPLPIKDGVSAPGGGSDEIDWDEVIRLDPASKTKIERFLDSREKWNLAEEKFFNTVDAIHASLGESHRNILRIMEDTYDEINDNTTALQEEIQRKMVENFHRREGLQATLQEAAEKQNSMFARLIASVSRSGARAGGRKSPLSNVVHRKRKEPDS